MTKRLVSFLAVFVFAVALSVPAAEASISIGMDAATWLEGTETDGTGGAGTPADNSFGFGDPAANLHIYGDVAANVDAYIEVQSAPNTGGNDFFDLNEAYLTVQTEPVDIKLGEFEVDFGNRHLQRSDRAQVQENPLIGNDIADFVGHQVGVEFSGDVAGGNMGWAVGLTNGAADANFHGDRGFALAPKIWGNFGPGLKAAFSYYMVDHSTTAAGGAGVQALPGDNLFDAQAFNPYQSGAIAQATLGNVGGVAAPDISAWQLDFGWESDRAEVNAWWATVEDDAPATAAELSTYGLEGAVNFTPNAYGAARYSVAEDDNAAAGVADSSDRLQVGVGYNLNENTLAKLEWVDQTNENPTTGTGAGVDAGGFIAEMSVNF